MAKKKKEKRCSFIHTDADGLKTPCENPAEKKLAKEWFCLYHFFYSNLHATIILDTDIDYSRGPKEAIKQRYQNGLKELEELKKKHGLNQRLVEKLTKAVEELLNRRVYLEKIKEIKDGCLECLSLQLSAEGGKGDKNARCEEHKQQP